MKKLFIILILILKCNFSFSQTYQTSEIVEKAEFYLKKEVGDSLFKYFKLGPKSYYQYRDKEKTINGKRITFILYHPDFNYPGARRMVDIELGSNLELIGEIYTDQIPKFLLKNKPSNWLTENEIDSIIKQQNMKTAIQSIPKRLEFDKNAKQYYWIKYNVFHKERCLSDKEILNINPISGIIIKHYEERKKTCF